MGYVLGSGKQEGREKYREEGVLGGSGLWELGIGGRGLLSALRDGLWKILTCCGLSIFDSRLLPFPLSLSSPPHATPSPLRAGGLCGGALAGCYVAGFWNVLSMAARGR